MHSAKVIVPAFKVQSPLTHIQQKHTVLHTFRTLSIICFLKRLCAECAEGNPKKNIRQSERFTELALSTMMRAMKFVQTIFKKKKTLKNKSLTLQRIA